MVTTPKVKPTDMYRFEAIGENVTEARELQGITRYALARDCGIHDDTLRDFENGKFVPKVSTLIVVADRLGVRLDKLLEGVRK